VNLIPSLATFTAVLRDPDEQRLEEQALANYLKELAASKGVSSTTERLVRVQPVTFDETIVTLIEKATKGRGLQSKRMTSGAGPDAQMMAVCTLLQCFSFQVSMGLVTIQRIYTRYRLGSGSQCIT